MQLSRFSDYSLRVLLYAASHEGRLVTLAEIASFFNISIEHLRKVVHTLAKSGYIKTYRGKNGGITLAKPCNEVNLKTLIELTEGAKPLIDCAQQQCCLGGFCTLQEVLAQAQQAFMAVLQDYNLEQLLNSPQMLAHLQQDSPVPKK